MMQFLVLVKGGKGLTLNKINAEERKIFLTRWRDWLKALKQKGWLVTGSPLVAEGKAVYSTGSILEVPDNYDMATEMVTGFCVITALDDKDAMNILQSCPFFEDEFTNVELRGFKNM